VVAANAADAAAERKGRSRDKFYWAAASAPAGTYQLLCPNCKALLMLEKRMAIIDQKTVEIISASPDVFVWTATLPSAVALRRYPWIDAHEKAGREAYILLPEGAVYRYGHFDQPVAATWQEFAAMMQLPPAPPEDAAAILKR
jgi:hypothetical protein